MPEITFRPFPPLEREPNGHAIDDIKAFIEKYGFDKDELTEEKVDFRMYLLSSEYIETMYAYKNKDIEETIDGLIDLVVIALGTLEIAGVDVKRAWLEVMRANMTKTRGVKFSRKNSGGFDLSKPDGWKSPSHLDNHGKLGELFDGQK